MPSQRQLLDSGRTDLLNAVRIHGGAAQVARRAALAPLPAKARKKPPGYWTDPKRLHAELLIFTARNGHPGLMPRRDQLMSAGRGDLNYAIEKHGGYAAVASALHLVWHGPCSYWRVFRNVRKRVLAFMNKLDTDNVMPCVQTMQKYGRMDLVYGVAMHGGVMVVARRMGLKVEFPQRVPGYWSLPQNVTAELEDFIKTQPLEDRDAMPTSVMLVQAGRTDLANAIRDHGGWVYYAQMLGLRFAFEVRHQGFWENEQTVLNELSSYVQKRYGFWEHPGREPRNGVIDSQKTYIPSTEMLKRDGRSDIAFAIQRYHGGVQVFASKHSLVVAEDAVQVKPVETLKRWVSFAAELSEWIAAYGANGIMPFKQDLIRTGRHDLRYALYRHGGACRVSRKMQLVYVGGDASHWLPQWLGLQAGKLGLAISLAEQGKDSRVLDDELEGRIVGSERRGEEVGVAIRMGNRRREGRKTWRRISIEELKKIRGRYKHLPPDDIITI